MLRNTLITCEFSFEACHQLRRDDWSDEENARVFGDCARLHGHSYRLLVTLRGPIEPGTGMVRNFRDVKRAVKDRIIARVDHNHLDEVVGGLTTAENLCYWAAVQLLPEFGAALYRIELWETRSACAALGEAEILALGESVSSPSSA